METKRFLVTGGTGFIGSNLVRRLVGDGHEVHIISRLSTTWRLTDILDEINTHKTDLKNTEELREVVQRIKPNVICHLATYGAYQSYQTDAKEMINTNIIGTLNFLNACSNIDLDVFINTGTSSEYGLKYAPIKETDTLQPVNIYGASKAAATLICHAFAQKNEISITTLRPFSVYGYYEEAKRFVPYIILSALGRKPAQLASKDYVRDFVFVEDVVDAYIRSAEKAYKNEIFNVGIGKQLTLGEAAEVIIEKTGSDIELYWNARPPSQEEPKMWVCDNSKARLMLNWSPRYSFESGIEKTIGWFRNNLELYNTDRS